MTLIEALICLTIILLLFLLSCFFSYRAYAQRKTLTRNSLKLTIEEAKRDKKPYPWIYGPAALMITPIAVFGLFLGNYGDAFLALGVFLTWGTYHLLIWVMWKIHDVLMFEKPKEPVLRLQVNSYQRKRVFSLRNIRVQRARELSCVIYQVTDENGQIYFVKGELDNPSHAGNYDIVVSIGEQTGRLYFEKIKKVYPPVDN